MVLNALNCAHLELTAYSRRIQFFENEIQSTAENVIRTCTWRCIEIAKTRRACESELAADSARESGDECNKNKYDARPAKERSQFAAAAASIFASSACMSAISFCESSITCGFLSFFAA